MGHWGESKTTAFLTPRSHKRVSARSWRWIDQLLHFVWNRKGEEEKNGLRKGSLFSQVVQGWRGVGVGSRKESYSILNGLLWEGKEMGLGKRPSCLT